MHNQFLRQSQEALTHLTMNSEEFVLSLKSLYKQTFLQWKHVWTWKKSSTNFEACEESTFSERVKIFYEFLSIPLLVTVFLLACKENVDFWDRNSAGTV